MLFRPGVGEIVKRAYSSERPYSTALGILPEYYENTVSESKVENVVKAYSDIPGPKGLPFIGNSWRFAPFIGKSKSKIIKIPFIFIGI